MVKNHHRCHRDHTQGVDSSGVRGDHPPHLNLAADIKQLLGQMPDSPGNGKGGDGQGDVEKIAPEKILRSQTGEAEGVPEGEKREDDIGHRTGDINNNGRQHGQSVHGRSPDFLATEW